MIDRKGIILAGGKGTRLYPVTRAVSKQLLPIYDKPMIYYPLSVLMLAGIREILLITTEADLAAFDRLLNDGSHLGLNIQYRVQDRPNGLPEAFVIGQEFLGGANVAMILGDNIFFGQNLPQRLQLAAEQQSGATIFVYPVAEPDRYGVVELDSENRIVSLTEKPAQPKSNLAITGLYYFDNRVCDIAAGLAPSRRGETEIVDVIRAYHDRDELVVDRFGRGMAWLDTGTFESLHSASQFVETIQKRQGLKIACLEEIAYNHGYIDAEQLRELAIDLPNSYGDYLHSLLKA